MSSHFAGEFAENTGSTQANSLLRSLFDMRMARQTGQHAADKGLSAPLAHPTAPTYRSLDKQEDSSFHPLRVTGSQAMLAKQAGLATGVPSLMSTRRHNRRESGGIGKRDDDYDFVKELRVEFEEDQAQRFV